MATEQPPVQPPPEELSPEAQLAADAALAERIEAQAAPQLEPEVYLAPEVQSTINRGLGVRVGDYVRTNPLRFSAWTVLILAIIVGFFWPDVPKPHVALGGEPISTQTPWWLTNSILTTMIVDVILIVLALSVRASLKLVPNRLQNFMELVLEYFYGLAEQVAGKAARSYFPWVMTIFLLVVISNWTGLIPGVGSIGFEQIHIPAEGANHGQAPAERATWNPDAQLAMADGTLILLSAEAAPQSAAPAAPATPSTEALAQETPAGEVEQAVEEAYFVPLFRAPSADLNFTFALAIATMFTVQIWGVRALGGSYFKKFFNFRGRGFMLGINIFVGFLELISELARILTFGFRLFGNIFAGEIVLATMAFLAAFVLPLPFYILEFFIGIIQAFVFCMLALVFFSMATQSHGGAGHHEEGHREEGVAAAHA